jgi:hypothetical protein
LNLLVGGLAWGRLGVLALAGFDDRWGCLSIARVYRPGLAGGAVGCVLRSECCDGPMIGERAGMSRMLEQIGRLRAELSELLRK